MPQLSLTHTRAWQRYGLPFGEGNHEAGEIQLSSSQNKSTMLLFILMLPWAIRVSPLSLSMSPSSLSFMVASLSHSVREIKVPKNCAANWHSVDGRFLRGSYKSFILTHSLTLADFLWVHFFAVGGMGAALEAWSTPSPQYKQPGRV